MTSVITRRNIPAAYDALIRTVWWQGKKKPDQRNNTVSELRNVMVEVMTPEITYPDFGPTSKLFGDEFAKGLIDPDIAEEMAFKFDYSYGDRIHGEAAESLPRYPESSSQHLQPARYPALYGWKGSALCNPNIPGNR